MTNNHFKYWYIALQLFGINYVEDASSKIRTIFQKLITCFIYCTVCFTAYGELIDLINRINNSENLSQAVGFIGYHVAVLATYTVLQCKRQFLHKCLENLSQLSQDINSKKYKQMMLLKVLSVACPLPFSLYYLCYAVLYDDEVAHTVMWAVVVNPLNMFFIFLGVFICYVLDSIFEQFKIEIKMKLGQKMDYFAWRQLIKHFIARHKKLSQLIDEFENIYANIYLIYFVLYTTLTIFLIRGLNLNDEITKWNFILFLPVSQAVALFLLQAFTVSRVNLQVLSSVYLMKPQPLITNNWVFEETKISTILTNSELSLYIQQVCANPSALTAGNYFTINKGVILSAGATILTYILVLYGNNNN